MCKLCDAEGALTGEMERVILENTNPGHNKHYTLFIEAASADLKNGGYRVMARYGPIGKWTKTVPKAQVGSLSMARQVLRAVATEKLGRGYEERVCRG